MSWFEREYCFSFHLFRCLWKSHFDNSKSKSLDFSYKTTDCCERSMGEDFRNFNECVFTPWVSGSGPKWESWDDPIFNRQFIHFVKQGKTKTTKKSKHLKGQLWPRVRDVFVYSCPAPPPPSKKVSCDPRYVTFLFIPALPPLPRPKLLWLDKT